MSAEAGGPVDRRSVLGVLSSAGLLGASALAARAQDGAAAAPRLADLMGWDAAKSEYTLPKLPYAYAALEPHLDAATMELHHTKHHQSYVTGLNKAIAELAKIRSGAGDASLIKHWSRELAFHGGGHVNHALFWLTMAPPGAGGGGEPTGALGEAIARDFGSFASFSDQFQKASVAVEGAGWGWLVYDQVSRRLLVQQMERQQDLLVTGVTPLLGVDVWEHAYYLKYQNRRAEYVKAFMNVINWGQVGTMFEVCRAR